MRNCINVDKYSFRTKMTDDNEIKITQTGDTLKLYIDQVGFGNKVGGDDASGGSLSAMTITGSGLDLDFDFNGNQNILFRKCQTIQQSSWILLVIQIR